MNHQKRTLRACAAQISPVFFDKRASTEKYAEAIVEAGKQGVEFMVTPETGIPTYPYWRNNFGYTDSQTARIWKDTVYAFYDQAVRIPGPETEHLGRAARAAKMTVAVGVNEQDDRPGSGTLYNTMLFIGPDGDILGRHRKLMPTHQERIFWGRGDASDLRVFDAPFGKVGGLICFENHMTMLKAVLASLGEEVHAASWPGYWSHRGPGNAVRDMRGKIGPLHHSDQDAAVREYAFETQSFVVSASMYLPEEQVPDDFPWKESTNWAWACGGSAIANPFGAYAARPMFGKEGLVIADLDLADRIVAKNVFDCMGHYSRWDVVQLLLNPKSPGPFAGGVPAERQAAAPSLRKHQPASEDEEGERERRQSTPPPRAIIGALPVGLAEPLMAALAGKLGMEGGISAHRAELDADDLEGLAQSHGLSHEEVVSLIHDFMDLVRRRSELIVPDFDPEEPADA